MELKVFYRTGVLAFVFSIIILLSYGFSQKMPSTKDANINAITPPLGFDTTSAFNGYLSIQNSAAIMMLQLENSNYIRISDAINEDYIARNKLILKTREDIKTNFGDKGKELTFTFELNGTTFIRKMVFIGDTKNTLWLNITYPMDLEELLNDPITRSISSANLEMLE